MKAASWLALVSGLSLHLACSVEPTPPSQLATSVGTATRTPDGGGPLFAFEGSVDARGKTLTLARLATTGEVVAQTTLPYGTTPGSVYFHTCGTPSYGGHNLTAQVQAVNLMAGSLTGLVAVIDSVSLAGVTPASGAIATYGTVPSNTPDCAAATTQTWSFNNPTDGNFTFRGHAEGTPPPPSCATRSRCRVFVTSTSYTGDLGGLAGADAKCQDRADAAGILGTFKAFLSVVSTRARDRLVQAPVPYTLIDGTLIVSSFAGFGSGFDIPVPIDKTELGTTKSDGVFTWSSGSGARFDEVFSVFSSPDYNCANWTSTSKYAVGGGTTSVRNDDIGWAAFRQINCSDLHSLFCFEQ